MRPGTAASLQTASLQTASLQPASLQPASLQTASLQTASLQPASLQPLSDHAWFQELLPAFHGLPAPPRFQFGTFPAELAAFHYGLCGLGAVGVWSSDALVVGPGLLLRTADGALVKAPQINWQEHDIELAVARGGLADAAAAQPLPGDAVLMVTAGYPIYGHWLADMLPRLIVLARAGHDLDRLTFLVPANIPDFAQRLLQMIGIDSARLHFLAAPVRPERLLMPTFPHNGRQFMALAEAGFRLLQARIEARFGRLGNAGTPGRILISRVGYGSRPLQNRAAFEALAKEYGFTSVSPQNLPLIEQVQMFASAHAIIGEYGSGLHNTMFSPSGTVVAAIRGPLRHPAFIQSGIGDALQQPTGYIFGSCGDHTDHPDFAVDMDAVRDCLRLVFPATAYRPSFQAAPAAVTPGGAGAALAAPPALSAADALRMFRQARLEGNWEAALAAGRLLTADGDDTHCIAAEMAVLCRQLGRTAEAVTYAVAALRDTPADLHTRQLLTGLLPPTAPTANTGAPNTGAPNPGADTAIRTRLHIDFLNNGNGVAMFGKGWSRHAPRQRLMLQKSSTLMLPRLDPQFDWLAELDVFPASLPARLRILLDWLELRRFHFAAMPDEKLRFRIPGGVLAGITPHTLTFEHPDARTPRSIDGRDDDRLIAFGARSLLLLPVAPDLQDTARHAAVRP